MPSREYIRLERNVAKLKSEFLNFSKRLDGKYTVSELLKCRAFITFSHAEVEHYFESLSSRILSRAEKKWDQSEKHGNVVAGLLCFRNVGNLNLPDNPRNQSGKKKLSSQVKHAFQKQYKIVDGNNGIKPKNVAELFLPLGVKGDEIEEPLMIQLESFGSRRGDMVHASSQVSLPRIRDPFDDEESDLKFLILEIKKFDELVRSVY